MSEIMITKENYEKEVGQAKELVLVDFYADWCGPCKMLAPVMHEIAEEYKGRVKVVKLNVDQEMELAQMFRVVSIPTVVLMKGGKEADRSVGYYTKDRFEAMIAEA